MLLKILAMVLPSKRARDFVRAPANRFGLTWAFLLPYRFVRHRSRPLQEQDCALVLLDGSWEYPGIWSRVAEFKNNGGCVVGVVYDTIPISHPELCGERVPALFKEWLFELLAVADGIVCISSFSARCVEGIVDERRRAGLLKHRPIVSYFQLGAELDWVRADGAVASGTKQLFERQSHIFLVVGTIEPRKNHAYILDAFEQFWASGGQATLVIIGKKGWKSEELLTRVAEHPKTDDELHHLSAASDNDLEYAYKNASALILASEIEGFGLPIVEAFQRGLPVLCSDIPIFREVADSRATYFDLSAPANLFDAIVEFCSTHNAGERAARTPQKHITWEQSARQLLNEISEIYDKSEPPD